MFDVITDSRPRARTLLDWRRHLYIAAQTTYAVLLVLLMLLPANFIANALTMVLSHGDALAGARYAATHHLAGYWLAASHGAIPASPGVWWIAATWECLFWASCGSAIILVALWLVRAAFERVHAVRASHSRRHTYPAHAA
jgi:hypothetical protein